MSPVLLKLEFTPEVAEAAAAWLEFNKLPISKKTPAVNVQLAVRHGWLDWTVEKGVMTVR